MLAEQPRASFRRDERALREDPARMTPGAGLARKLTRGRRTLRIGLLRIHRVTRKIQRPGSHGIAGDVDRVDRIEDRSELFIRPPHAELVD